jgi:hypothetical protein
MMGLTSGGSIRCKLAPFEYSESVNTPGLWTHKTRPVLFTLVVDNFGVKYVAKDDVNHLIASIKTTYNLTEDWTGNLYCGITLNWDYVNRTVDISMPGYIKRNCRSMSTSCQQNCNRAHTHPNPKCLEQKRKRRSPPIPPQSWMRKESNEYNKSSGVFYITRERLI